MGPFSCGGDRRMGPGRPCGCSKNSLKVVLFISIVSVLMLDALAGVLEISHVSIKIRLLLVVATLLSQELRQAWW